MPRRAEESASLKSADMARIIPPPRAWPLMREMVGTCSLRSDWHAKWSWVMKLRAEEAEGRVLISWMSAPPAKADPRVHSPPVRITQRRCGLVERDWIDVMMALQTLVFRLLSRSGLVIVRVATMALLAWVVRVVVTVPGGLGGVESGMFGFVSLGDGLVLFKWLYIFDNAEV